MRCIRGCRCRHNISNCDNPFRFHSVCLHTSKCAALIGVNLSDCRLAREPLAQTFLAPIILKTGIAGAIIRPGLAQICNANPTWETFFNGRLEQIRCDECHRSARGSSSTCCAAEGYALGHGLSASGSRSSSPSARPNCDDGGFLFAALSQSALI